jgi:hypothetical protein
LFIFCVYNTYLFQLLPAELVAEPACQDILRQYSQSFSEVLKFENGENDGRAHEEFNKLLTEIKHRHQVSFTLIPPLDSNTILTGHCS